MTVIKAITYAESREAFFEKQLKRARRGLDNVVKYGTDLDACAEQGEIVSFYQDAISALREQAERDKGCLYCAGYEAEFMLPVIEMSENTAHSLDIDGNFAYIHCHCGRHTVGKINYCPMRGRRLEAQHE